MHVDIVRYSPSMKAQWDEFVDLSKNGTFLFKRDYMDYHSDRFDDYSLMAFSDKHGLIGVLPANRVDDTVCSHGGLTYGGWVTALKHFDMLVMEELWHAMEHEYKQNGVKTILYRAIPYIYHRYPADEDIYAIFKAKGTLLSSQVSSVIDLNNPLQFDQNASRGVKSAAKQGITIQYSDDYASVWTILSELLKQRYDTLPVHSLDEIELLHHRFPGNIKLFTATLDGEVIAASVVYFTHTVAHAQYICASPRGKESNALPALFAHIINNECGCCRYFDFGTSNEKGGWYLNEGLIRQKCGMGGRAVAYNTYRILL